MKDNKYKSAELIDTELGQVNGGIPDGKIISCHHPGCFVLSSRLVEQGITLDDTEPITCTMCQHWGVEGPCNLDD